MSADSVPEGSFDDGVICGVVMAALYTGVMGFIVPSLEASFMAIILFGTVMWFDKRRKRNEISSV